MEYGRFAISYLVKAYAVLASLPLSTYDGGEWIPGFVIVLYIFVMSFVACTFIQCISINIAILVPNRIVVTAGDRVGRMDSGVLF